MGPGVRNEHEGRPPAESRNPRVVYLDHVARLSGGELALLRLLRAQTGVDAHVILAEHGPLVARLLQAGVSVEVLPMPERTRDLRKDRVRPTSLPFLAIFDTLLYTLRVAWRLCVIRPDIVHTNSLKAGLYGSIAARLVGRPVIWHLRDRVESDYLPPSGVRLIRALTRRLPQVVISNSAATMHSVRPKRSAVVIWSVVESMADDRSPRKLVNPADRPLVVGMTSRVAPWKGQDVFLRAFAKAFPSGDQRARIVGAPLFGQEEEAYAAQLHRLADELGIADRVEFRGHRDNIAGELAEMDILVHAATIPEPFGQVIIEGMSAHLPVVATHGGGPDQIISDRVDGLLYASGDVDGLANILLRLEAEPELRLRLGNAAAARARDFSPPVVAAQLLEIYKEARRR